MHLRPRKLRRRVPGEIDNLVAGLRGPVPGAMQRNDGAILILGRRSRPLQEDQTERRGVRLNALVDSVGGSAIEASAVGVLLHIPVEWHVVHARWRIRIGIAEWPAVVSSIAYSSELVGWMIVHVRLHHFAVVVGAVAAPVIVERVGDVVPVVDDDPEGARSRDKREPL